MSVNKFKVGDVVKCVEFCDSANAQQPHKFKFGDVVKCVDAGVHDNLTVGKEYIVIHSHIGDGSLYRYNDIGDDGMVEVENDKGSCFYYYSYRFELSSGGSANAQQTHKSPKFKEGDMVYLIGFGCLKPRKLQTRFNNGSPMKFKVEVVNDVFETFTADGKFLTKDATPRIVLSTEENRLILNKLLGVEYEPVKLTGSDLAKKLLKDNPQTCYVSDISDDCAKSRSGVVLIMEYENDRFISKSGVGWKFAVPCDSHGNVLEDE